jgi:hypothetical protein
MKKRQNIHDMNLDEFISYLNGKPTKLNWLSKNKYNLILAGLFCLLIFLMLTK